MIMTEAVIDLLLPFWLPGESRQKNEKNPGELDELVQFAVLGVPESVVIFVKPSPAGDPALTVSP